MTTSTTRPYGTNDPLDVAEPTPTTHTTSEQPTAPPPAGSQPIENDPSPADSASGGLLITPEHRDGYRARWATAQGDFIDEPRTAVTDADALVGEAMALP
jgi:hypothetical protein